MDFRKSFLLRNMSILLYTILFFGQITPLVPLRTNFFKLLCRKKNSYPQRLLHDLITLSCCQSKLFVFLHSQEWRMLRTLRSNISQKLIISIVGKDFTIRMYCIIKCFYTRYKSFSFLFFISLKKHRQKRSSTFSCRSSSKVSCSKIDDS